MGEKPESSSSEISEKLKDIEINIEQIKKLSSEAFGIIQSNECVSEKINDEKIQQSLLHFLNDSYTPMTYNLIAAKFRGHKTILPRLTCLLDIVNLLDSSNRNVAEIKRKIEYTLQIEYKCLAEGFVQDKYIENTIGLDRISIINEIEKSLLDFTNDAVVSEKSTFKNNPSLAWEHASKLLHRYAAIDSTEAFLDEIDKDIMDKDKDIVD
jgi:hypothetical protein